MKKLAGCVWIDINSSHPPPHFKAKEEVFSEMTKLRMLDFEYS